MRYRPTLNIFSVVVMAVCKTSLTSYTSIGGLSRGVWLSPYSRARFDSTFEKDRSACAFYQRIMPPYRPRLAHQFAVHISFRYSPVYSQKLFPICPKRGRILGSTKFPSAFASCPI